ncbi:hypothetical protein Droror1_Dr00027028 [Drosera rotundifolia]
MRWRISQYPPERSKERCTVITALNGATDVRGDRGDPRWLGVVWLGSSVRSGVAVLGANWFVLELGSRAYGRWFVKEELLVFTVREVWLRFEVWVKFEECSVAARFELGVMDSSQKALRVKFIKAPQFVGVGY